jgi:uncharacterized protein YrrD
VFRPDDYALAGFLVARPDLLFMFKRKDRFLAFDAFRIVDGRVVATIDRDSWDAAACKRLDLDWDTCLILEGMALATKSGEKLGVVDAVEYDERTGALIALHVAEGTASKALIGVQKIPRELIVGFRDGRLLVKAAAGEIQAEGGLAAKAGEQAAVVTQVIREKTETARQTASDVGKKAGGAASKAIDTGSRAFGRQLGRSKGMFKAFRDEYRKSSASDKPGGRLGGKANSKADDASGPKARRKLRDK